MVQFLLKLLLKQNSCCAPRFPLIAVCYKIVGSQTSFTLCQGVGVGVAKFWKLGVGNFNSDSATLLF